MTRSNLPAAERRPSSHRSFDPSTVERIKLVKQLQEPMLTLDEAKGMLLSDHDGEATCARESVRLDRAASADLVHRGRRAASKAKKRGR